MNLITHKDEIGKIHYTIYRYTRRISSFKTRLIPEFQYSVSKNKV